MKARWVAALAFVVVALMAIWFVGKIMVRLDQPDTSAKSLREMHGNSQQVVLAAAPGGEPPILLGNVPPSLGETGSSLAGTTAAETVVQAEMESVKFVVRDFRAALDGNPVGNNAEITRALMGANRSKTRFLDTGAFQLNDSGELIDHWGTPYFFHQISGHEMEIRSAGPDRRMWTGDD